MKPNKENRFFAQIRINESEINRLQFLLKNNPSEAKYVFGKKNREAEYKIKYEFSHFIRSKKLEIETLPDPEINKYLPEAKQYRAELWVFTPAELESLIHDVKAETIRNISDLMKLAGSPGKPVESIKENK